jgi:copper(I)-binding protein
MKQLLNFILCTFFLTTYLLACPKMYGTFEISNQKIVFLNGTEVGAAYLTIVQTAPVSDRLIGAKFKNENKEDDKSFFSRITSIFSSYSKKQAAVELHDHVPATENPNILAMKRIKNGVEIPAAQKNEKGEEIPGKPVQFETNGKHLMLYHFPEVIRKSDKTEIILTFEKAGDVSVIFPINPTSSEKEAPCPHHNH